MTVSILSHNVDKRLSNFLQTCKLILEKEVSLAMIQDMPCLSLAQIDQVHLMLLNNYRMYNILGRRTINGLIIRHDVELIGEPTSYRTISLSIAQFAQVKIRQLYGEHQILIVNLYIKPRVSYSELNNILNSIKEKLSENKADLCSSRIILAGDLNATLPQDADLIKQQRDTSEKCYSNLKLKFGRKIESFLYQMRLIRVSNLKQGSLANDVDQFFVGNKLIRKHLDTYSIQPSRNAFFGLIHHPIIATFSDLIGVQINVDGQLSDRSLVVPQPMNVIYRSDLIAEKHTLGFKLRAEPLIRRWQDLGRDQIDHRMNSLVDELYICLEFAQNSVMRKRKSSLAGIRLKHFHSNSRSFRKLISKLKKSEQRMKLLKNFTLNTTITNSEQQPDINDTATAAADSRDPSLPLPDRSGKRHCCSPRLLMSLSKKNVRTARHKALCDLQKARKRIMNRLETEIILRSTSREPFTSNQTKSYTNTSLSSRQHEANNLWRSIGLINSTISTRRIEQAHGSKLTTSQLSVAPESNLTNAVVLTKDMIDGMARDQFPFIGHVICATTNDVNNAAIIGTSNANSASRYNDEWDNIAEKDIQLNHGDEACQLHVTYAEFSAALYAMRNKNYTGPHGIRYKTFFKVAQLIKPYLFTICRMSFNLGRIPNKCRLTEGLLIPKRLSGKFRIVHIATPLSSLLEQIILHKLEHALENKNCINRQQFGFTAHRSRHDLQSRILEHSIRSKLLLGKKTGYTTIINLDIEGAFDNIDQPMLISKLKSHLEPPSQCDQHLVSWLANFILTRKIRVRYGNLISETRHICKGVPQGSPLGPILWNFAIHDIDEGLNLLPETEILTYADDLFIVMNGIDSSKAQRCLDELVARLAKMKLSVNLEKSQLMTTMFGKPRAKSKAKKTSMIASNHEPSSVVNHANILAPLMINGKRIAAVGSMNILGTTITEQLTLDRESDTTLRDLPHKTNLLLRARNLNIIHKSLHWQTLFKSLILSIVVQNNVVFLAADKATQIWIDKILAITIKRIFGWPNNVSTKFSKLLLDIGSTRAAVFDYYMDHSSQETMKTKQLIAQVVDLEARGKLARIDPRYKEQISSLASFEHRRYADPSKLLCISAHINDIDSFLDSKTPPLWLVMSNGKLNSIGCQILQGKILQKFTVQHQSYATDYFNQLTLVYHLTRDKTIADRNLIFRESDYLLAALMNAMNRDWRIISIRESIFDNCWQILTVNNITASILTNSINRSSKGELNPKHLIDHRIDELGVVQEHVKVFDPDLADYRGRYNHKMLVRSIHDQEMHNGLTKFAAAICKEWKLWQAYPASWLNSVNMLTLTGLRLDENSKQLVRGYHCASIIAPETACCERLSDTNFAINTFMTLHRTFVCPNFESNHKEMLHKLLESLIPNYRRSDRGLLRALKKILKHVRFRQKLIKTLTRISFPDNAV